MEQRLIRELLSGVPDPLGNVIVVDAGDIDHGLVQKPEIIGGIEWIKETIENPDLIFREDIGGRRYYEKVFYDDFGNTHRIWVVVDSRTNLFKTIIRPRRRYYDGVRRGLRQIWPADR